MYFSLPAGSTTFSRLSPSRAHRTPGRLVFGGLLAVLVALLTGCAPPLPQIDREAIASSAIGLSPQTTLGHIAQISTPAPDQSGFRLMPLGTFSYDTRLQ